MISDNMRGAALMVAGQVAFVINDAFMKALAGDVPFLQAMFLRGVMATVILLVIASLLGQLSFRISPGDRWRMAIRTICEALAAYFFISALFNMPLANAVAILQMLPLSIALAAYLFMGEPLGWRRLTAVLIGFVGVMLIIRPGFDGFSIWSLNVLAAVVAVTIRDLVTRRMASKLPSLMVALAGATGVMVFSGIGTVFTTWDPVSLGEYAKLFGATLGILGAYIFSVLMMRVGEVSFVVPFRYSSLVAALILGLLVFGEWPDAITLLGSAIVVGTGLYMLYREVKLRRAIASASIRPS
ncbi:MAG: DMT family transporter [Pseudomonadota bacterium]